MRFVRISDMKRFAIACMAALLAASCSRGTQQPPPLGDSALPDGRRLPTGARLDAVGRSIDLGNMPLAAIASRDGRYLVVSLGGWREQGIQIVDRIAGAVVQRLVQPGAFFGLAWSTDAQTLYASGGTADAV